MEKDAIAQNIKRLRKARPWSQEELADASGVSVRTIQRAESGRQLAAESLRALAAVFDTTLDALSAPDGEPLQPLQLQSQSAEDPPDITGIQDRIDEFGIRDAQLEMQRLDALSEDGPEYNRAGTKLQKIFILQGLIKRLQREGRPAMAWKLQRQVEAITNDGRVATSSQRKLDKILDIEAERNVLREEANRSKRGR